MLHTSGALQVSQSSVEKMNLPPPVTKKAYNSEIKHVKEQAVNNTEKLMCEAAAWLRSRTATENPEIVTPWIMTY